MAITRYTTRRPATWQNFDQMFDRFFNDRYFPEGTSASEWVPAVEISESADQLTLRAELPGMAENDIELEFENGVLTLRGEKKAESEREDDRYHVVERRYGAFQRSFTLPRTVVAESMKAEFDNGVLTVHMPKAPEAKSRKIEVSKK